MAAITFGIAVAGLLNEKPLVEHMLRMGSQYHNPSAPGGKDAETKHPVYSDRRSGLGRRPLRGASLREDAEPRSPRQPGRLVAAVFRGRHGLLPEPLRLPDRAGADAPPPEEYGFDESKTVNANGPSLGEEAKDPYFRAQSTGLILEETIRFISEHRDRPFYVNVWTLLPHALLRPTPEQLGEYEALAPKAEDPAFGPWMRKYLANAKDLKSQMQVFCASLTDIDTQ